jgi:hypothetical protein
MTSDGMLHYQSADIPMGEFWLRSPTHDKPNDVLDAISGAHVYGKPIVQAEGFTELRMAWDEYPGMLKTLQDRNYALGINRLVFHVFAHNPWMDRRPGMTLDGVGLYFQRDQTWWKPGKAWMDYTRRCQALLQIGRPVADIAVFTGEEIPRRAILPDRLVSSLPGIFGDSVIAREARRLENVGVPLRTMPAGVVHAANMTGPGDWIDPLHGYVYDSFNPDVLLRLATVDSGWIVLPGGARYALLVLPSAHPLSPDPGIQSAEVASKLLNLVRAGATVMINGAADHAPGLAGGPGKDRTVQAVYRELMGGKFESEKDRDGGSFLVARVGKGRVIKGPFQAGSFEGIGLQRDLVVTAAGELQAGIAYTHRVAAGLDIYFISNQRDEVRLVDLSLRVSGREPELWDPVTGSVTKARGWSVAGGRTKVPVRLEPNGSVFIVFRRALTPARPMLLPAEIHRAGGEDLILRDSLQGPWVVQFDKTVGGPAMPVRFDSLQDWSANADTAIRYYSGTTDYSKNFSWKLTAGERVYLDLGKVANIAAVAINGVDCGVAWTPPYRVEITKALRPGINELRISVTNTWANRLTGDRRLPEGQRITRTTAPDHLDGGLLPAGLLGPVKIEGGKRF